MARDPPRKRALRGRVGARRPPDDDPRPRPGDPRAPRAPRSLRARDGARGDDDDAARAARLRDARVGQRWPRAGDARVGARGRVARLARGRALDAAARPPRDLVRRRRRADHRGARASAPGRAARRDRDLSARELTRPTSRLASLRSPSPRAPAARARPAWIAPWLARYRADWIDAKSRYLWQKQGDFRMSPATTRRAGAAPPSRRTTSRSSIAT